MSLRKCKKRECCTMTLWYKKSNVEFLVPLAAVEVSVRMLAGFSQTQATLTYTNLYKDHPVKNIQFDYPLKENQVVSSLKIVIGR
jgi:hypothetical protein